MPLKIELLSDYQLRTKDNDPDALVLPTIELAASDANNLPYISSIIISVSGTPEYLAQRIQSAYRVFDNVQPIKLSTPQRLKQSDCRLDQPLPADVNCTLFVSIDYFDSDESGNADLSVSKNVKAECHLFSSLFVPIPWLQTEQLPESSVEKTAPIPSSQTKEIPQPPVSTSASVPPSQKKQTSQLLAEKTAKDYPGWFAIDFGTSNSTVTLYDPRRVDPPKNLPKEQERRLRELLAQWVNQRATDDSFNISDTEWKTEWEKLLSELKRNFKDLNFDRSGTVGDQIFLGTESTHLLEAIRLLEISFNSCTDRFQRVVSKQLNQIYYKVSRVPPLDWQSLIPVELDRLRHAQEIPSELEIERLDPSLPDEDSSKVKVLMGDRARQNRNKALAKPEETSGIEGKFHHSPKRYFGLNRLLEVTLDGKDAKIPVQNLIQAAYAHLIQLTNDYREVRPERFAKGNFYTGVITYPTIAPPVVRREIEKLVKELGIQNVQIAYDEAVAVAIFYLLREFGGDLNIGIESFKTRCRRERDQWSQNVLILDIGGGTTDMALIRLMLEEIDPFESNEDRGNGGRYYKLTPKLLGSSGHLQLGGELITLRIFLLLKAAIADCVLSAVSEGKINEDRLNIRLNELNQRFLKNNDKFQSGTLLACVDKPSPEADAAPYKDALDDADKVVSTRFKNHPERLQTFYTLWEHAERAKLEFGNKRDPKQTTEPTFVLNAQQIWELLVKQNNTPSPTHSEDEQNNTSSPTHSEDDLTVTLTLQQFERAVTPVIKQAIGIAKGLMENRLEADKEQVNWLILSGKTCNLYLVELELYKEFSQSKYFLWNTERITFVPEYSKLATSIGACYAEKLRQLTFDAQQAKPVLRKGANQLYFDVKNLLYFLPCSFYREAIGAEYEIFRSGQQLSLVDPQDSVVKIRSGWQGLQLNNIIQRLDFEDMTPQLWGSYNGKALADQLNMNDDQLRDQINVQFEVDQNLEFSLLLCKGNADYSIPSHIPILDAGEKIGTPSVISNYRVVCDIAVCVAESATALNTDAHTLVFEADKDYSQELRFFWNEDDSIKQQGLIKTLDPFPLSGKHTFYFQFRLLNSNTWELIGELPQPQIDTEYPCKYHVSLDEKGILRIHAGEVPYRTSKDEKYFLQEGYVFRAPLDPQPPEVEENRDPFSGIH
jgi:hypothetical protein